MTYHECIPRPKKESTSSPTSSSKGEAELLKDKGPTAKPKQGPVKLKAKAQQQHRSPGWQYPIAGTSLIPCVPT